MKPHHWGILALTLLVLGGLVGYTLVQNGFFPLARVNGRFISLKTVEENVALAQHLYEQGLIEQTSEMTPNLFVGASGELFEEALESLIINTVIRSRVDKSLLIKAASRIETELAQADANLAANIKTFYGWDLKRFRERVLEPRAIEEVLREDLGDERYESWLNDALAGARVQIWFAPYEWQSGKLLRE